MMAPSNQYLVSTLRLVLLLLGVDHLVGVVLGDALDVTLVDGLDDFGQLLLVGPGDAQGL